LRDAKQHSSQRTYTGKKAGGTKRRNSAEKRGGERGIKQATGEEVKGQIRARTNQFRKKTSGNGQIAARPRGGRRRGGDQVWEKKKVTGGASA